MRLIDADALRHRLLCQTRNISINYALELVSSMPTVDPYKHGHWISHGSYFTCSVCGEEQYGVDTGRFYCQNCGAKMDEVKDE